MVKDEGQSTVLRNLLRMNEDSYCRLKKVCIILRRGSFWQSSNQFQVTRFSLDRRDTKYIFCYSEKHVNYEGRRAREERHYFLTFWLLHQSSYKRIVINSFSLPCTLIMQKKKNCVISSYFPLPHRKQTGYQCNTID